jgi:hypothetical protein
MSKAHFACKPTTMKDIPTTRRDMDEYEIMDTIQLPEAEWNDFTRHLMIDRKWLADFSRMATQARWYTGGSRPCILVKPENGTQRPLLIDTQGYDYPRYIAYAPQ